MKFSYWFGELVKGIRLRESVYNVAVACCSQCKGGSGCCRLLQVTHSGVQFHEVVPDEYCIREVGHDMELRWGPVEKNTAYNAQLSKPVTQYKALLFSLCPGTKL